MPERKKVGRWGDFQVEQVCKCVSGKTVFEKMLQEFHKDSENILLSNLSGCLELGWRSGKAGWQGEHSLRQILRR